eukprot:410936-Amphidinium_carterae.1
MANGSFERAKRCSNVGKKCGPSPAMADDGAALIAAASLAAIRRDVENSQVVTFNFITGITFVRSAVETFGSRLFCCPAAVAFESSHRYLAQTVSPSKEP